MTARTPIVLWTVYRCGCLSITPDQPAPTYCAEHSAAQEGRPAWVTNKHEVEHGWHADPEREAWT